MYNQISCPMKTITPKNALKLFLFLLILSSAKIFSHPRLPKEGSSSDCKLKIGSEKKATNNQRKTSTTYSAANRDNIMQSNNKARFKK